MRTAEELRYLILAIQREGNRLLAADLRGLGLTPSQAEVLRVLREFQPLGLTGLGELLVCETGTSPSRLVDRLVAQGLVERHGDEGDRRVVMLKLSPEGRRLERRVVTVERRFHDRLDRWMAEQPVGEAVSVLRSIADHLPVGEVLARRRGEDASPPSRRGPGS